LWNADEELTFYIKEALGVGYIWHLTGVTFSPALGILGPLAVGAEDSSYW